MVINICFLALLLLLWVFAIFVWRSQRRQARGFEFDLKCARRRVTLMEQDQLETSCRLGDLDEQLNPLEEEEAPDPTKFGLRGGNIITSTGKVDPYTFGADLQRSQDHMELMSDADFRELGKAFSEEETDELPDAQRPNSSSA